MCFFDNFLGVVVVFGFGSVFGEVEFWFDVGGGVDGFFGVVGRRLLRDG